MRYGAFFPTAQIGNDPAVLKTFATSAEAMGYDYIAAPDHVIQSGTPADAGWRAQYTWDFPHHEPLLLFSFMAAVTERIRLQTAVLIVSQRPTVLVAKQAAELDVLSGGRAELGVGIGWNALEFAALGQNFRDRGQRLSEQVELLRALWTEDLVTFEGQWHQVESAGLAPMPVQRPIPIWVGAFEPPAVRRAGRIADGWLLNPRLGPDDEDTTRLLEIFNTGAEEAGRPAGEARFGATIHLGDRGPNAWADEAGAWRERGASQITARTSQSGYTQARQHLEALERFAAAVRES